MNVPIAGVLCMLVLLGCGGDEMAAGPDPGAGADMADGDPLRACMQALPRLSVAGNRLVARCGTELVPTRLKGINRSGLQHKNGLALAGFGSDPARELQAWRDLWKTVVVRLPIGQTYYLYYEGYRHDLGAVVDAARRLGLYLILELHGYDADHLNEEQPDPKSTPGFWAQLARRFGGETHVLFDIWNEPHGVPWSTWKGNAELIVKAIRDAGAADTLVLVGGLDYAYDLSPLLDAENRIAGLGPIVYATHPYPLKSNPPSMAKEWDARFGAVAAAVPVIVGEYGVNDSGTSPYGLGSKDAAHRWMTQLHGYIDQHRLSALAWSGGDMPQISYGANGADVALPANPPDPARPTDPFGLDVQAWMRKPIM